MKLQGHQDRILLYTIYKINNESSTLTSTRSNIPSVTNNPVIIQKYLDDKGILGQLIDSLQEEATNRGFANKPIQDDTQS